MLGGGPAQRPAIAAAHRLGVRTIVCDADPARGDVAVSSEDLVAVTALVARAGGVIAPGTDWPVRIAAQAAATAGVAHPLSVETARLATDKLAQRERLARAGVPQPRHFVDGPPTFPCVVKPADRQGQRGIEVVREPARLAAAVADARAASRSRRAIVEEWLEGGEVTVNGFSADGRFTAVAVTDREHFDDAFGVCRRHLLPAAGSAAEAAAVAEAAVAALGISSGPSYVQLVLAGDGPRVIEVAARLGGGYDSELIARTVGVDLARAAVLTALGEPPGALRADAVAAAGVIEFLRAPAGRLVRAQGPSEACLYHAPGHVYRPLRTATDRAGHVLAVGAGRAQAVAAARRLAAAVTFEVT